MAGAGPPRARPSCNDDVSGATIPDRNVVDSAAGSLMLAKVAFEELETKVKQLILELEAVRDDRDCVRFQLRLAREAQLAEAPDTPRSFSEHLLRTRPNCRPSRRGTTRP